MKRVKLGSLEVSELGLGCMGMSEFRGTSDWDEAIATIHRGLDLGVTFLDTADIYGSGHNEVLIGRAVHGKRQQFEIATKFGVDRSGGEKAWTVRGDAPYVKRACEASLMRMKIDFIDLLYVHQPPRNAPIEETVGAMTELQKEGKIGHIGLSNVDDDLLKRACSVAPIAAVQSEYSLWTRDKVEPIAAVMAQNGVGLVPYGPLGRGFLTGELNVAALDDSDLRKVNPRFQADTIDANQALVETVKSIAAKHDARASQIALAWVAAQSSRLGLSIAPIPGTKRIKWLEENIGATRIVLTGEDLEELATIADRAIGDSFEFKARVAWAEPIATN